MKPVQKMLKIYVTQGSLCLAPKDTVVDESGIIRQILSIEGVFEKESVCCWPLGNLCHCKPGQGLKSLPDREAPGFVSVSLKEGELTFYSQDENSQTILLFLERAVQKDYLIIQKKQGWLSRILNFASFGSLTTEVSEDDEDETVYRKLHLWVKPLLQ